MRKILNTADLIHLVKKQKIAKRKVVLCHGVFDLIHVGHIKYFKSAKKYGDFLVVSLTSDQYVNKGPGRPAFNQNLRAELLASFEIVDVVYINNSPTSINVINLFKPDIYFKGPDYKDLKKDKTKNIYKEINAVKRNGGIFVTSNDLTFSSSNLINANFNLFNTEQKSFLKNISKKYSFDYILKKVDEFKNKKILLIGETIIDQYIFGEILGKSGKEPHLVIKDDVREDYLGGAGAIANHLSTFCKKIDFITILGEKKEYLNFVIKSLKKNVNPYFFYKKNSPTILKKRFIDKISKHKLLGVYSINDEKLENVTELKIQKIIKKLSNTNDLVIVSDYGHGLISYKTAIIIQSLNKFISLNAQVNASNYGYHSLAKYNKITSLIINENELRHEMRDKKSSLEKLSFQLMKNFKIKVLIITRGSRGSMLVRRGQKPLYCPAFASKVVDKVGAGDAMLSIISMCVEMKLPDDLTLYLGSLAGASSVESIGNSQFINKNNLLRQVEYAIK